MTKATEAMKEAENYNVKGVKSFEGHDGIGINANFYYGKKKIAHVHDGAYGGELEVHYFDQEASKKFDVFLKDYPEQPDTYEDSGFSKFDQEDFINRLVNRDLLGKELKNKLKKKVLYINKKGEIRQINFKKVKAIIRGHIDAAHKHYGNEFMNGTKCLNELPFKQALAVYERNT